MIRLSFLTTFLLMLAAVVFAADTKAGPEKNHSPEFRSMERKIVHLRENAAKSPPDPKPTELTEAEANAYFNEGGVKLPKGLSHVQLTAQPAVLDGHAQVDFDELTQGKVQKNPLLGLFTGKHDVHVVTQAAGSSGTGTIRVQSVALDGVEVPPMLLELFVQHYLTPKYPNVGMTSIFKLPLRIDTAVVETGKVRLVQK
jgi:hypothetical protein